MSKKKKTRGSNFLVQGGILAMAGIISRMIGLIYRVPLQNIMTNKGQGFYEVSFTIYSIALLLTSYGLPLAVSKLVSARVSKGEYRNAFRVFKAAMGLAITAGLFIAFVVFFGAEFIAKNLMSMELSMYSLKVLAPGLFIVAIMGVLRGYFQGVGSMIPTAVSQILEQVVNAVVSLICAHVLFSIGEAAAVESGNELLGASYAAAGGTIGTIAGALIAMLFLCLLFYGYKGTINKQLKRDNTDNTEDYKYLLKILFLTIAPVVLSTSLYNFQDVLDNGIFNRIMMVQGHTQAACAEFLGWLGKYNIMTNVPIAVANALAASLIPSLVAAVAEKNKKLIHNRISQAMRFTMLIAIPSMVGFIVLAKPILDLLYFRMDNTVAAQMLQLGAISIIFFSISTVTTAVLQGLSHMMAPVKNAAISLVIHIVALFIMLVFFKWGIFAVVLSKMIFAISMCILNSHDLREAVGYVQEQRKTFVLPGIAAGVMGIVTFLTYLLLDIFIGGKLITLIALVVAVLTFFITYLLIGGTTQEELLAFPKGARIVAILERLHLFKRDN